VRPQFACEQLQKAVAGLAVLSQYLSLWNFR